MRASSRSSRIFWSEAQASFGREARGEVGRRRAAHARLRFRGRRSAGPCESGGGPPGWTMTLNYCRKTVTNKGITDVTKFEQEVKKCFANPVTYPPAYPKPTW